MTRRLQIDVETWPLSHPLRISGHSFVELQVIVATLSEGGCQGRGEATGLFYCNDTPESLVGQIEAARAAVESGIGREELRYAMPPGSARNAVDCALWDLEAKLSGKPVWELAGLPTPAPLLTTYTLGADTPELMAAKARDAYGDAKAIKLKLLGDAHDAGRVRAVRAARPDVWLGVDANQGYTAEGLSELLPILVEADVRLVEQPCKVGAEDQLAGFNSPIALAGDESVRSLKDIAAVGRFFDLINIKLDKSGGLTEALLMVEQAHQVGLKVMVGNMGGTSLAMVPALLLGQCCEIVDIDGPLFLASDRKPQISYDRGYVSAPQDIWGW